MRAFLLACLATVVIGAGGYFFLDSMQQPSGIAYTTDSARIDTDWPWREPKLGVARAGECSARSSWQWIFVDLGTPNGESAMCKISQ